ncbi:carboxypeptidase family protein [Microbacterium sp. AG1240]|uniref:carboxypeptidase-like regulatory domain-containing protein n=1 Tax=Microbacterium sp. AG1240 TaxID=2183992 RepID=UPI000EAFDF69|nr:carboxypeptidase-like regulatory domain-containing protein [Microbacterium sp. AG1240]RKT36005.1 carboxypeptidase family protein [Microbacterium sp. AG1240]
MNHSNGSHRPGALRRAAALLASAVVAGSFLAPTAAVAAEPGTGRILGRLASETGEPIAGDIVAIDETTGRAYSATARSDGGYAISDVPAGRYAVLFRPADIALPGAPFGYAEAWFPNVRRGDDAARVIVDAGVETVDVDAVLSAAGRVSGVVSGAAGEYAVALLDEPTPVDPFDGDTLVVEIDRAGRFALRAPAGGYELLVYRRCGHEWLPYALSEERVELSSRSDVEVAPVVVPMAGAVELHLCADDGAFATHADVTLARQGCLRVERDGLTDHTGRVLFEGLAPGRYAVAVDGVARTPSLVVTVEPDRVARIADRPIPA